MLFISVVLSGDARHSLPWFSACTVCDVSYKFSAMSGKERASLSPSMQDQIIHDMTDQADGTEILRNACSGHDRSSGLVTSGKSQMPAQASLR